MPVEEINGTPISYETAGEGEPLVLVHGAWVDLHTWDLVAPKFSDSFFVVTYDRRGHGASPLDPPDAGDVHDDVADLAALIERLEIGPTNVAGNSAGACIALRLTVERPDLVLRTLAHEPPSDYLLANDVDVKPARDEYLESVRAVGELLESGAHREAAERFVDTVIAGPGVWPMLPPPMQDTFVRHALTFLGQLNDADALQIDLNGLSTVSTPMLLSQGGQSPPLLRRITDQLAAEVSNADCRTIADGGHVPHRTNPDEYVAMVTQFIKG